MDLQAIDATHVLDGVAKAIVDERVAFCRMDAHIVILGLQREDLSVELRGQPAAEGFLRAA